MPHKHMWHELSEWRDKGLFAEDIDLLPQLLDLEKEVINSGTLAGIPGLFPEVSPTQI